MNTTLLKQEQDRMQKEIDLLKELMLLVPWNNIDRTEEEFTKIIKLFEKLQEKTK